jgi:membrane protein required for colicin V production
MTWLDWAIVIVLAASVIGGFAQGFFRTACSLVGLILGLSLAAWNYRRIAAVLLPAVRVPAIADAIGFFLIALVVMALANLAGNFLGKALNWLGLGCLDMIAGAVLGFFQGVVLVTIILMVIVAFFPRQPWLTRSELPRQFFGALHLSTQMSPAELANKVRQGLRMLEEESPEWMHPRRGAP